MLTGFSQNSFGSIHLNQDILSIIGSPPKPSSHDDRHFRKTWNLDQTNCYYASIKRVVSSHMLYSFIFWSQKYNQLWTQVCVCHMSCFDQPHVIWHPLLWSVCIYHSLCFPSILVVAGKILNYVDIRLSLESCEISHSQSSRHPLCLFLTSVVNLEMILQPKRIYSNNHTVGAIA